MWVLTKNNNYINVSNNIVNVTSNILNATLFKDKRLAEGYINNNIAKKDRYKYKIENCDTLLLDTDNYYDIIIHNLTETINNKIKEQIDTLVDNQSLLDRQQSDILHYIENTDKIDMYTSWLLINKLRDIRKQRRIIKNLTNTVRSLNVNEANIKGTYVNYSSNTNYTCKGFTDYEDIFKSKE